MKISLVYSSQMGTTEYVSQVIAETLTHLGHSVTLHSVKLDGYAFSLAGVEAVIFGAPTYDLGALEVDMEECLKQTKLDLSQLSVAVLGLGDRSFPQFCTATTHLETWVKANQGQLALSSLQIDGYPHDTTDITNWATSLHTVLSAKLVH